MKKLLTLFLFAFSLGAMSQKPMSILDATADKVRKMGDVKIAFTATTFVGSEESGAIHGTMLVSGKKLHLSTEDMKSWYDGKTQWSMLAGSGEVNVTTPTQKEIAAINPYSFISHYKKGYRLSMKKTNLRGKEVYEIHMTATKAQNPAQEIYVDIAAADHTPLCIRVRQDSEWNRISLLSLQGGMNFPDSDFTFPKEQYPNVEIIDLR